MNAHHGTSIKLFLVDGTPQGILTAEIMNWTGHVLAGPRPMLARLLQREETNRTGIYFLTGPDPDMPGRLMAYIGESDNVGDRLKAHNKDEDKAFWEKACIITSKDANLTKAHARYLEARLTAIAQSAGQARIYNVNDPDYGFIPEADIADMEYFISQVRLMLPVLGLEFLREKPAHIAQPPQTPGQSDQVGQAHADSAPVFITKSRKYDFKAEAQEVQGEFIVTAGSEAQPQWIGGEEQSYYPLHKSLFEAGKLALNADGTKAIFQEDVTFKSPSAAAAIIYGRAANGRKEWKVKSTNKTYDDWHNEQLANITTASTG